MTWKHAKKALKHTVISTVFETAKKEGILEGASSREVEIARAMKKDGHPTETIAKYTGLKKEEIEKL